MKARLLMFGALSAIVVGAVTYAAGNPDPMRTNVDQFRWLYPQHFAQELAANYIDAGIAGISTANISTLQVTGTSSLGSVTFLDAGFIHSQSTVRSSAANGICGFANDTEGARVGIGPDTYFYESGTTLHANGLLESDSTLESAVDIQWGLGTSTTGQLTVGGTYVSLTSPQGGKYIYVLGTLASAAGGGQLDVDSSATRSGSSDYIIRALNNSSFKGGAFKDGSWIGGATTQAHPTDGGSPTPSIEYGWVACSGSAATVTFQTAFTVAPICTLTTIADAGNWPVLEDDPSTTGFKIHCGGASNRQDWMCIGGK